MVSTKFRKNLLRTSYEEISSICKLESSIFTRNRALINITVDLCPTGKDFTIRLSLNIGRLNLLQI